MFLEIFLTQAGCYHQVLFHIDFLSEFRKDVLRVFLRASASPRQAASLELHAIPTQTEQPASRLVRAIAEIPPTMERASKLIRGLRLSGDVITPEHLCCAAWPQGTGWSS